MEIIFIRHGQGEHNLNVPDRLNIENPHLTEKGRGQVEKLKLHFTFTVEDLFIASPTIRTIETTNILTSDLTNPKKYISSLAGPRMFPLPLDPESYVSKCDLTYPVRQIESNYADFNIMDQDNEVRWLEGINTMQDTQFIILGQELIHWIQRQEVERAFIIAHDGTITNYRQLLGEEGLTRADFLGEAGWYKIIL